MITTTKNKSKSFTDSMRVTSIKYQSSNYVIFTGVPILRDSYKINSGKYYISILSKLDIFPIDSSTNQPIKPALGQHWEVTGSRTIKDSLHGDYVMIEHEYKAPDTVKCTLPETGEALIQFIANGKDFKGIGDGKARAIWTFLKKDFHATLRKDTKESRERLGKIDGLTEGSIDALFLGYAKYANLSHYSWMSEHSIPAPVQQRLFKYHTESSIEAVKANPYLLYGFGMKWEDVDGLAQSKFKVAINDHRRLSSALEMSIQKEVKKGHTYASHKDIYTHLRELFGKKKAGDAEDLVAVAFQAGYDKAQYILNAETGNYHPTAQFLMESVVAKRLLKLAQHKNLYNDDAEAAYCSATKELPYKLTQKQTEAVLATLDNAVSCITGGAGTGKTTVLRTALRAYKQVGFEIHAVALSGRAAQRLHESIGFETMTIARLLRSEPIDPSDLHPNHVLVIDEASMIDLPTMYRLVTSIHPTVRIIFTGDPDQLPPIGCGKVLSDIVESKAIVNTMLDIVKRQEGSTGIPEYSKLINQGIVPDQLSTGNIHFHETSKDDVASVCTELYRQSTDNSIILSSTNKTLKEINTHTQTLHNPDGQVLRWEKDEQFYTQKFRLNDAILFTKNDYSKGINNGSLGKLISVEQTNKSYGVVKLDSDDEIEISESVVECMSLGYCITLHKAQGSQFPRIIIALEKGRVVDDRYFVDRAWLYTVITRAESEIHIVGSAEDFAEITRLPSHSHLRRSYLPQLLSK